MTSELKPCPFCGSDADLIQHEDGVQVYAACSNSACVSMPTTCCNEDHSVAISDWNTRAAPDVPELYRYDKSDICSAVENGFDPLPSDDGDYVLHSQAAEIIAADRAEIKRLKSDRMYIAGVNDGYEAAEAKLAQYEAQEPVGYISIDDINYLSEGKYSLNCVMPRKLPAWSIPLYASPAPAADLKTENERLRGALEFYADVHKYPSPLTGGMGDLWSDCGQIARAALNLSEPQT